MQRITVTVEDQIVDEARREVAEGRAASLSAWVSDAMRQKALARIRWELELDELREAEPYTQEAIDWAADVLEMDPAEAAKILSSPIRPRDPRATGQGSDDHHD